MFGIDDLIASGLKVLDKFIPDPEEKAKAEAELRNSFQQWDQQQTEVNKVEAAHRSIFVAGWRPFIGWICGSAFALHFVLFPVMNFILAASGKEIINLSFDMNALMTVLVGMLGLGGLRTYEKMKGVTK
jgi:hypothetical protein